MDRNGAAMNHLDDLFLRAEKRRQRAQIIIDELGLLPRWSQYGSPVLVGAFRHNLMVAPDIDMEVYTETPTIEAGFAMMTDLARLPGVWKVRFSNELAGPDQGLYWQLRYRDQAGEVWKVDAWLMSHHHPDAHWAERFVEAMHSALTPETRWAILEIKEALQGTGARGIDIYRAVLEGGVRRPAEFEDWLKQYQPTGLIFWLPIRNEG
jgi:hypothetical protein